MTPISTREDRFELSLADLDAVTGGKDGDGNETGTGRGDGLGKLRQALGGGLLGEVATVVVQTGRAIRNIF